MPRYFFSSAYTALATSSQLADNIPATNTPTTTANCCCPSTTTFLSTLVDKLYTMSSRLKEQFDSLEEKANRVPQKGIIFAEIDTSVNVAIKYEYILYLELHGPPIDGIFDEALLAKIRAEMAATS